MEKKEELEIDYATELNRLKIEYAIELNRLKTGRKNRE